MICQRVRILCRLYHSTRCISTTQPTASYDKVLGDMRRATARKGPQDKNTDSDVDFLEVLEKEKRRRQFGIMRSKTARELPQPKEERVLTRNVMNQIRFLRQEYPEEWTIIRLAESFGVSQNIIIKVLKSRFMPNEKKQGKQDDVAKMNQRTLLPGSETPPLPAGTTAHHHGNELALRSEQDGTLMSALPSAKIKRIGTFTKIALTSQMVLKELEKMKNSEERTPDVLKQDENVKLEKGAIEGLRLEEAKVEDAHLDDTLDGDGRLHERQPLEKESETDKRFTDPHIDEIEYDFQMRDLMYVDAKPVRVTRKGNKFYDEEGNFLYCI